MTDFIFYVILAASAYITYRLLSSDALTNDMGGDWEDWGI